MSKKRGARRTGGNLDVDAKASGVQAPHAVGIGAAVVVPRTGTQKIKTDIGTVTGDVTGLVIGAVIRGGEDES